MSLDVKVIARTFESNEQVSDEDLYILGGKMAGVCYMPEDYFDSKIQDKEKALAKANFTCNNGHHSVFDHGSITFQISGLPKIMAMLLNSTEQYTTSEKSARYTVMKPETELELTIYNKWKGLFEQRITEVYKDKIDEKTIKKLALENARYLISVFTPTHMVWTTTYRQIAYIIEWMKTLHNNCTNMPGEFNKKLAYWCNEMVNELSSVVGAQNHIIDNKNRELEFFSIQSFNKKIDIEDEIGDVYQVTYLASFAHLAQAQRHRTIHYEMQFNGDDPNEFGVYIPLIIRGTELEKEYIEDFKHVAYCYPQGTLVKVLEQGRAIKFFEKCKERLCGRAQLEIMVNSARLMQKFIDNKDKLSPRTQEQLEKVTNGGVVTKCRMKGIICKEACVWGGTGALDRLI